MLVLNKNFEGMLENSSPLNSAILVAKSLLVAEKGAAMVFRRCGGYRLHASSVYRANIKRHKTLLFYYFNTCYHLSLKSEKERIHYYVKMEKLA